MTVTFGNVVRGVAIGDSWGNPVEFHTSIDELTKNSPRGIDLPAELTITDDTQMTLYLADALDVSRNGTKEEIQKAILEAFLQYYHDPDNSAIRAPGGTVMGSLGSLNRKDNLDWKSSTSDHSDGSGTVMRTSAVAFVPEDKWVGISAFAAASTHGTANAIAAAILNVAILRKLLSGETKPGHLVRDALLISLHPEQLDLAQVTDWLDGYEIPGGLGAGFWELSRLLFSVYRELPALRKDPWAITADPSVAGVLPPRGGGWRAHETLVIALLAVDMIPNDSFEALRRSVITTGDSDTIGAVTGGLLGAAGAQWPDVLNRMEERYEAWIVNEADDYEFTPDLEVEEKERFSFKSLVPEWLR